MEKRLTARNKKIIDKIFSEFKEKIVIDNASKNDLKIIIDIDYEWLRRKIKSGLETLYTFTFESTLKSFQNIYNKKIKSNTMKGIKDYFLKKWNKKNAAKQATRISKTTQIKLNKIITTGQEEGISHNEMVEKIVKEVNGMTAQRASTIARTETSKSINATSFETAKGIMKEKCWIHVGGKKMYRAHHGVEALYPHEDGLPASEVVRCSCLIIFR